ncbi:Long chain acyl-CoA synthetase 4 [Glycine soja]|nr:Long chain acyl-CoA synthetase 4 [Glycine soja]
MAEKRFIVKVEKATEAREGKPPIGPVYRSIFAHDPLPPPIQGLNTRWDIFSYKICLLINMIILKLIKNLNLHNAYFQGVKCGIYGANCPEWIMNMEACNAQGLYRVPLYDTLEQGHNQSFDLPVKKKSDVCTIMYTSGTTGDPKGVLITNESIITLLAGIQQLLKSCNEKLNEKDVYLSYLPLAHIFARVIEEAMIMHGASIGFWSGGGNVRIILSGAAPLSRHVEGFLRVVTCALISFNDMVRSC